MEDVQSVSFLSQYDLVIILSTLYVFKIGSKEVFITKSII